MNKINILFAIVFLFTISCKEDAEKPKVSYDDKKVAANVRLDSAKIQLADLPIQLKGTQYLIHPIGNLNFYDGMSKSKYGWSQIDDLSFSISNNSDNEITGYLSNFKFQHIDSTNVRVLSEKTILIERATFINLNMEKIKKQILVYILTDADTNKDEKIDTNDIKSLYISDINGTKFKKISQDYQELIDWNLLESTNKLYFRTIEDTNKNGRFDKGDKLHYQFLNLNTNQKTPVEYNPV